MRLSLAMAVGPKIYNLKIGPELIIESLVVRAFNSVYLNCTDKHDVAKIKVKSVTDHQ